MKKKKRLFLFLAVIALLIIGIGSCSDGDDDNLEKKVKLDDQFIFEYFVVNTEQAKFYEKEGKAYMDLSFDWKNNFGEEAKFIRAGSVFAYQGENELEEITNAYSDTKSDVHFPNAAGGTWGIKLTYELKDKENPVKVVFVSHETEKEEELQIDIK